MRIKLQEEKGKPFSEKVTDSKSIDNFPSAISRQPPHHDWLDYRYETINQQKVEKESQVISFDEYCNQLKK